MTATKNPMGKRNRCGASDSNVGRKANAVADAKWPFVIREQQAHFRKVHHRGRRGHRDRNWKGFRIGIRTLSPSGLDSRRVHKWTRLEIVEGRAAARPSSAK